MPCTWHDQARDAGYRGDEAEQAAAMLEAQERQRYEEWQREREIEDALARGECPAGGEHAWGEAEAMDGSVHPACEECGADPRTWS